MADKFQTAAQQLIDMLEGHAQQAGRELVSDLQAVRDYAAIRIEHLSSIVAEPGFVEALEAETDSIALKAAGRAIERGDAFDARIVGIIQGTLATAARLIA